MKDLKVWLSFKALPSALFALSSGGAGSSHCHCPEDLEHSREDRTPWPKCNHMSKWKKTNQPKNTVTLICKHMKNILKAPFPVTFLVSSIKYLCSFSLIFHFSFDSDAYCWHLSLKNKVKVAYSVLCSLLTTTI